MVLEKTLVSPLDCKIQLLNLKENQHWVFTGRIDAAAETPIFWPPEVKSWLNGKDPEARRDLRARVEGGIRGWDGWMASSTQWHEFGQTPGDGEGQRSLACCSPQGTKSQTQLGDWTTKRRGQKSLSNWWTGLPWWSSGLDFAFQCRGCGFDPWSRS